MPDLTVLHTSDWHLGHQLYRKRRDREFEAFLEWLSDTLVENHVDALVISGDIFDTGSPGTFAQSLYYSFLGKLPGLGVRHVVITGGNHDSPSFLQASAPVLINQNIHVIPSKPENMADEVLVLRNRKNEPELVVCAAPFLREGELCEFVAGESFTDRENRLQEALKTHFADLAEHAEGLRAELGMKIPVMATAHLFTEGIDPDREESSREIYRGNLGCMPLAYFPDVFDYVALGHIHKPGAVNGMETRRYSGSPLPMTFAEARYDKEVTLIKWHGEIAEVRALKVPRFRKLLTVKGNSSEILASISGMVNANADAQEEIWLEIQHDGTDSPAGLPEKCQQIVAGTTIEVLCVKSVSQYNAPDAFELDQGLDDLRPAEMFRRCLEHAKVPEENWAEMQETFNELLTLVNEEGE